MLYEVITQMESVIAQTELLSDRYSTFGLAKTLTCLVVELVPEAQVILRRTVKTVSLSPVVKL